MIENAKNLAYRAHDGQKRKYGNVPYIVHPQRVAEMVADWCLHHYFHRHLSEIMVSAAWLHDVIEDCPQISENEISEITSPQVLKLVQELTNPSKQSSLPRAERKSIDREHIAKARFEAQIIKLLDRLDNLKDMTNCDKKDFILLYCKETELLLEAIGNIDSELTNNIQEQIAKLKYGELAENIVDDILSNLSNRCGIGNALEEVDPETYDHLEKELIEIVKKRLGER